MFCDRNHGVIYENNGNLWQLDLKNIRSHSNEYNFNKIKENRFWNYWRYKDHIDNKRRFLSMTYLKNQHKIFAMKCKMNSSIDHNYLLMPRSEKQSKSLKCGIFGFNSRNWQSIQPYEYESMYSDKRLMIGISKNQFDSNVVFTVSNMGNVVRFDMKKNKWQMIYECLADPWLDFVREPVVWMDDPNTLCCAQDKFVGSLDIRSGDGWNQKKHLRVFNNYDFHTNFWFV